MKLAIHGTNDGYRIMYTNDEGFARLIARDIRKGARGDEQLGSTAYALVLINAGCVYSKYVIVKDSLRSFSTGTIAFSLLIERNEKIIPRDIYNLLNELYSSYSQEYIKNHYLNLGQNTLVREDWSFVDTILRRYNPTPQQSSIETLTSGSNQPAIVYYEDEEELLKYFAKPYQPQYADYQQILFIERKLQGKEDPINVLRNSGRTLNIDLNNDYYLVNNYEPSKNVKIKANERQISKSNNKIWIKDKIEIDYSKDSDCFEPVHEEGYIIDDKIKKYILAENGIISIRYEAFENPEQKSKDVIFEVLATDKDIKSVIEYQIDDSTWRKTGHGVFQETFRGAQLKKKIKVACRKGELHCEDYFIPLQSSIVRLILRRRKILTFELNIVDQNGRRIDNYRISPSNDINIREISNNTYEFIDEAIKKECIFYISADGYEKQEQRIIPEEYKEYIKKDVLIKIKKRYLIDATELGSSQQKYSYSEYGDDVRIHPKSRWYRFKRFHLDLTGKGEGYDGTLVANYTKRIILNKYLIGLLTIVIIAVCWAVIKILNLNHQNHGKVTGNSHPTDDKETLHGNIKDSSNTVSAAAFIGKDNDDSVAKTAAKNGETLNGSSTDTSRSSIEDKKAKNNGNNAANEKWADFNRRRNITDAEKRLIQSDKIDRGQLKALRDSINEKKSIELYLEFWSLVEKGDKGSDNNQKYEKLQKKIRKDSILKESALNDILLEITASVENFENYKIKMNKDKCRSIKDLNELLKPTR